MARFELGGELIEAWIEGDTLMTRRGHVGAEPSPPVARLVGQDDPWFKEWEGAIDPARLASAVASYRYTQFQSECLRDGWRRVYDSDREESVDSEPREPAFDRALHANPGDRVTAAVYADWLEQRGHPRGALISLQQQTELDSEAQRLLQREETAFLGPLAGRRELALEWENGFIRAASIAGQFEAGDSEDLLWDLLRHPSARFLRELELSLFQNSLACIPNDSRLVLDLLLLHPPPRPPLSRLKLDLQLFEFHHEVDLWGLDEAYPGLQELLVEARNLALGELQLPRMRCLVLDSFSRLTGLPAVIGGTWPDLVELGLSLGYNNDYTMADLAPLLDGTVRLPRLRVLSLRDVKVADELCSLLVRSPLAPNLEVIDLANGALTDHGAAVLLASDTFASLRQIAVGGCSLSDAVRADSRIYDDQLGAPLPGISIASRPRPHRYQQS